MTVNSGVDAVRRAEQKTNKILKKTRFIWLKNPENLTDKQSDSLNSLKELNLDTALAYQMKLNLKEVWMIKDPSAAEQYFEKWYSWVTQSRLDPMIEVANTLKRHIYGILNYFKNG